MSFGRKLDCCEEWLGIILQNSENLRRNQIAGSLPEVYFQVDGCRRFWFAFDDPSFS